ncbi:SAM-dependent MidA family methyltransferase [Kibdelosporangium banguiense]|uniref:SAM-dependent MidA family methyltransferase n=1 Tax=Kibdelosporangium banguiense TaxID=1365924 RepID=A0ABS4TLK4_9PSEU|nr:SAM-dependent methyltransferase [Kibdelosporangium banguiense]MBP2325275.1 SAM-dependent MidA family methyltransferase [Kibdelosporangium banguiense]
MWMSWRTATQRALYAENGFYRRTGQPARHYRTSVHASPRYAEALLSLMPDAEEIVDVGAGSGELLLSADRDVHLIAVEIAPRPARLPARINWVQSLPSSINGLVIANEWLDNIPVDVVEQTPDGPRLVMVSSSGSECLGDPPSASDLEWLSRWWPLRAVGERAEIGLPRDQAWADLVSRVSRGVVVAADYAHFLGARPPLGTLTGYRDGLVVTPVPDGSCDITAHVALDSCAASVDVSSSLLTTQRDALRALGIRGSRPDISLARTDPPRYLRSLQQAGEEAELIDPGGLGGFGWLVQSIDTCLPASLSARMVG